MTLPEAFKITVEETITELALHANMAFNRGDRVRELECDQQIELLQSIVAKAKKLHRDSK